MPEMSHKKVEVNPDLYDLVSVLTKSLSDELKDMIRGAEEENYSLVREKIHSSKGAALTFGFTAYAKELEVMREFTLKQDANGLCNSLTRLKLLLENAVFVPAE